jgi:hypothetical protein
MPPGSAGVDVSTEFDWLKFYTNLNRNSATPSAQLAVSDILRIYKNVCDATMHPGEPVARAGECLCEPREDLRRGPEPLG